MQRSITECTRSLATAALAVAWLGSGAAAAADAPPPEPSPAASEMLQSMREKGVITEEEYEDLYRRQAQYEQKQREESALPGWLDDWTFGGDLRLRWERQDWREPIITPGRPLVVGEDNINFLRDRAIAQRDRFRVRLRVGGEKRVTEDLEVGFRLVSSQPTTYGTLNGAQVANFGTATPGDPRSTNQTFTDYFSPKNIYFDRAYVRYSPWFAKSLSLSAGKIANPFLSGNMPDSFVWDPDIQPEGGAAEYHFDFMPEYLWSDTRAGYFLISEVGEVNVDASTLPIISVVPTLDEHDPYMWAVQQEITAQPFPWLRFGGRASYYDLKNLNTQFVAAAMDLGNTGDAISQNPLYVLLAGTDFASNGRSNGRMQQITLDGYFTWNGLGDRWQVTPFIQWMFMPNASYQDTGLAAGVSLGDAELLKVTLMYARMEANAVVSLLTDSDIFDGFTNAKGWYVSAERRLARGVRMRAAYMDSRIIQPLCDTAPAGRPLAYCNNGAFTASPSDFAESFTTNLSRYRVQVDLLVDF